MIPYFIFDHFNIGPLRFYTWGLFVGIAFSAGYLLLLYRAKDIGSEKIVGLTLSVFLGAAVGSRLFFLLQQPQKFLSDISLFWHVSSSGLMLWGGILGGILGGWLYVRFAHLNFWQIADWVAPSVALGVGIGYIGCSLINDHIGALTNLPWGILWPDGSLRHPVAEYVSLVGFIIFGLLFWAGRRPFFSGAPPRTDGRLFLFFLASFGFLRFFLDFFRETQGTLADPRWQALTMSQWIALVALVVSVFLFVARLRRAANHY